jgi:ribosomal protein S15P/S13E
MKLKGLQIIISNRNLKIIRDFTLSIDITHLQYKLRQWRQHILEHGKDHFCIEEKHFGDSLEIVEARIKELGLDYIKKYEEVVSLSKETT